MYSYRNIYEESNGALYVCNWQLQTCENVLTQSYRVIWEIEGLFGFLLVPSTSIRFRLNHHDSLNPFTQQVESGLPTWTKWIQLASHHLLPSLSHPPIATLQMMTPLQLLPQPSLAPHAPPTHLPFSQIHLPTSWYLALQVLVTTPLHHKLEYESEW